MFRRGEGVVLFEPSVVAVDEVSGRVQAIGRDAQRMIGRTPATIRATRPLRHGVVADLEMAEQMLRHFVRMACGGRPLSARAVVCVPTGITEVERRAVEEATLAAGAKRAHLIEEPLAGAIGAGLPVAEPSGSFVLDIGGGTSEMAVVALGGMVVSHSVRIGGYELDDAIVRHVQNTHKLLVGPQQAERVKLEVGSAIELEGEDELTTEVTGRDLLSGLLRRIELPAAEVRTAIAAPVGRIVEAVHDTLERTPPELAADVADRGLVLVGGGALLRGLDRLLASQTGLPVAVAEETLTCVARGAGASLEEIATLDRQPARRRR